MPSAMPVLPVKSLVLPRPHETQRTPITWRSTTNSSNRSLRNKPNWPIVRTRPKMILSSTRVVGPSRVDPTLAIPPSSRRRATTTNSGGGKSDCRNAPPACRRRKNPHNRHCTRPGAASTPPPNRWRFRWIRLHKCNCHPHTRTCIHCVGCKKTRARGKKSGPTFVPKVKMRVWTNCVSRCDC